jgi:hypothetical protein
MNTPGKKFITVGQRCAETCLWRILCWLKSALAGVCALPEFGRYFTGYCHKIIHIKYQRQLFALKISVGITVLYFISTVRGLISTAFPVVLRRLGVVFTAQFYQIVFQTKLRFRSLLRRDITCPEVILSIVFLSFFALSQTNYLRAQEEKQSPRRGQGVEERNQKALDPLGVRAGGFLLYPKFEFEEKFNSNIYAKSTNEKSDFITVASPSIEAKSNFNRHSLDLAIESDFGFHAKIDDENYQDFAASAKGRIDVISEFKVNIGANFNRKHEPRGSPDDEGSKKPTIYRQSSVNIDATYKPNRASISLDWKADKFDYDDASKASGTAINNDDRDKSEYVTSLRLGYDVFPENEAFVKAEYNIRKFVDPLDDTGLNRDSNGYRISAGTTIDLTGLMEGEFSVGYMSQSYDDAQLPGISAPFIDGKIDWHITPLSTLTGKVGRSTVDTTSASSPGYVDTKLNIDLKHELFRNQIIGAGMNYSLADYKGIDRTDHTLEFSANSDIKLNRNAFLRLNLTYRKRDSNLNVNDFDETVIALMLGIQF